MGENKAREKVEFSRKSEESRQERRKLSRYWKETTVQLGKKMDWYIWKKESNVTKQQRRSKERNY